MSMIRRLNLFHIETEYQRLFSQLYNHETGEIDMEIQAQIDALEIAADQKCVAIANWIKRMEIDKAEIDMIKREVNEREAAYAKEIEKWQNYLKTNMEKFNITEIKSPYFTLKLKHNPLSTDIIDASAIPKQFIKTKVVTSTTSSPDKNAIKEEFKKTGMQIPGAFVSQKLKLEILVDKI